MEWCVFQFNLALWPIIIIICMFNNNSAQILTQNTQNIQKSSTNQQIGQTSQVQASNQNLFQQNQPQTNQNAPSQQKQYQSYLHEQELLRSMNKIHDFIKSQELNKFGMIIDYTLRQTYGIISRAVQRGVPHNEQNEQRINLNEQQEKRNKQVNEEINRKYTQIRERNMAILKAMLNLRKKLMNQMYMNKICVPAQEAQLQKITEKISMVSNQIRQKIQKHNLSKYMRILPQIKVQKEASIQKPLFQLKAASEKLCRQTLKFRQELKLCIKFLNTNDL